MGNIQPGNPAFAVPPAADDQARKQKDLERQARENAAARSAEATTIGAGGLLVKDGGSIRVEAPGTIDLPGGAFSANSLASATTITAGSTISTPANVQGGGLVSTGNASVAGTLAAGAVSAGSAYTSGGGQFDAGVRSVGAYGTLVTGGGPYVAAWIHSDGRFGYAPSSRRFKTGFQPIVLTIEVVLRLQGFYFQYLAAVPYSQEAQREMMGLLAEDTDAAGFPWLVDYDDDGEPFGIRADILAVVVLEGMRDFYGQFVDLREQVVELLGRVAALEGSA